MTFSERMKEALEQGWAVSKEIAAKAGAKAQDMGERGILMIEIKQMENQAQKTLARMGTVAYIAFTEHNQETLNKDNAEIKGLLEELALIKDAIDRKEAELRIRRGN
jgi:hypothetical protein